MNLGSRFSQHSFAQVPQATMARSKFDRSFQIKDTFDFDYLVPIFADEILPGDTVNLNVRSFARLASQQFPIMDNMFMDYYFFFVPNRLVWENWERFNGAQGTPGESTDFIVPKVTINTGPGIGWAVGSMADHFGIPTGVDDISVCAFPFRAYNLVWNEWFRDQNLQASAFVNTNDGPDDPSFYTLRKAAKKHDYFTSALPWPQKGEAVSLPLGLQAPVYGPDVLDNNEHKGNIWQDYHENAVKFDLLGVNIAATFSGRNPYPANGVLSNNTSPGTQLSLGRKNQYGLGGAYANAQPPYADLTEATAATINQFRQAMMMQSFMELDARGGTRYTEILKAHFGVISPDFRLQRPEFLSGGTVTINQHVVAQTSETNETPQGNLSAFSTASTGGNQIGFSKSFVEHGWVIGLVRARGEVTYQQGLNRKWTRETRHDYYWPKFQQLGEQAILNKEIYATGNFSQDNAVFGYQERHAEYRYSPSEIRGQFRSTYAETLDVWHLAEEFSSLPALNSTFIQSNTPIERALVVTEGYPHLKYDAYFEYKHARPMMTYAVPATLGRF